MRRHTEGAIDLNRNYLDHSSGHPVSEDKAFSETLISVVASEFGTFELERLVEVPRRDAWLYVHGRLDSPVGQRILDDVKQMFYPGTPDWLELLWFQSELSIAQTVSHLCRLATKA